MEEEKLDPEVTENRSYNFLINTSNQANLCDENNVSRYQINSLFVFIEPYILDNFKLEKDLNIEIKMDERGVIYIDDRSFEMIELKPGIKVFGLIKDFQE